MQVVTGEPAEPRGILAARPRAVLRRAVLRRAVLRRAVLRRAVLRRAVLRRAVLRRAVLRRELCPEATMRMVTRAPGYSIKVSEGELGACRSRR